MTTPNSAQIQTTAEYAAIRDFYTRQAARRTGLPYLKHIDEGLAVLNRIQAPEIAMRGYCLHPIFQSTQTFAQLIEHPRDNRAVLNCHGAAIALATEYRWVANGYLLKHHMAGKPLELSPITAVNQMLIADKLQNHADFMAHHYGTHARSTELQDYFRTWHRALGVDPADFTDLFS